MVCQLARLRLPLRGGARRRPRRRQGTFHPSFLSGSSGMHATSPIMTLGMLCAALPLVLAADTFSNAGLLCKAPCHMDGLTGACHTNFCGTRLFAPGKTVACCKLGVKQSPCDGTVGCHQDNCCTAVTYTQSPALPPPPPPPRPPPHYATAEDATLMAGAGACNFASLRFKLGKIVEDDHRDDVKGGASVAWSAASTRAASDSLCQRAYPCACIARSILPSSPSRRILRLCELSRTGLGDAMASRAPGRSSHSPPRRIHQGDGPPCQCHVANNLMALTHPTLLHRSSIAPLIALPNAPYALPYAPPIAPP